jgi:signal transduction histidine kinase
MESSKTKKDEYNGLVLEEENRSLKNLMKRHLMLGDLGQLITSEINLENLFELVVRQMKALMHAETCSVFLHDPDTDTLWSMVSNDLKKNRIRISTQCGIAGWVYNQKIPQIVNAPYEDPRFFKGVDRKTGFRTRNILCIPLINRSKQCIGTLQVLNKQEGDFTEQDLELFESASHYVTIALENARLYENLNELDRIKEKVIHHISHELKTPLVILKGAFSLINKRLTRDELSKIEKNLERGKRNIDRLSKLQSKISDIMVNMNPSNEVHSESIHKVLMDLIEEVEEDTDEFGLEKLKERIRELYCRNGIKKEYFNVNSVLNDVCKDVKPIVKDRSLCLMQKFDEDFRVYTDKTIFRKACNGLLKNAIENTPDEGFIEVVSASDQDGVTIEITDHGVGITEENQKQIFSGFFPTQPTEAYMSKKPYAFNAGGTGVDLLRIKTFAKQLNFQIAFKSHRCTALISSDEGCPGRATSCSAIEGRSDCFDSGGSTFTLRFPNVNTDTKNFRLLHE